MKLSGNRPLLKCHFCGKEYPKRRTVKGGRPEKYCSKICMQRANYKHVVIKEKKCPVCKKNFTPKLNRAVYCSAYCYSYRKNIKNSYNVEVDFIYKLLKEQNNKCIICNLKFNKKNYRTKFNVDHNHKTGVIRGLLCNNCNFLLGQAKDDIDILNKAIRYLEREDAHRK